MINRLILIPIIALFLGFIAVTIVLDFIFQDKYSRMKGIVYSTYGL